MRPRHLHSHERLMEDFLASLRFTLLRPSFQAVNGDCWWGDLSSKTRTGLLFLRAARRRASNSEEDSENS